MTEDQYAPTESFNEPSVKKSQIIGHYKLLQKLGEGGMGTVWMAEQEKPVRRRVALKVIKAGLDNKQVIARFEAERQALSMMNHENIAKILDAGTSDHGQPYFVMELVQGIPFNAWCDTNKLSINERLELFIPVCKAVQHAHQKGIIHRDLKPSNILVCSYDGRPVPKVIDFGLAKALEPNSKLTDKTMFTEFGQVVGTLQYMSPEQAEMNQLDIDTRTDIYSLGVILYELLTGSTPIDQQTLKNAAVLKILQSIRETDPPRPSARLSSITHEAVSGISAHRQIDEHKLKSILRGELDWIVMKSIDKNRSRRYETANDFADDIQHYLQNEVVIARPPSRRYRIQKYVRKHKGLAAAITAITLLLVASVAISSWFAVQANMAKLVAERKTDEALSEKRKAVIERKDADAARIKAASNEQLAKQKTQEVLQEAQKTKKQLVRFYTANGIRFAENGEPWEAISWYAKALESEPERDPASESAYRTRIGGVMANAPKLAAVFFHESKVFDAVLSPDGTRLVTLPEGDEAWLIDVATQSPISRLKHDDTVLAAVFSPDGATVATGGNDQKVRLWSSTDGKSLGNAIPQTGDVRSIDFHPSLPLIAVAAGEATIWDIQTGKKVTIAETPQETWHVKFSVDGKKLVVAYQQFARVWNTSDWLPISGPIEHTGLMASGMVGHIRKRTPARDKPFPSLSPDGVKLAVFGSHGPKIVDLESGGETPVNGHGPSISTAVFSADGKQLLVCGFYQKLNIYETQNWQLTNSFPTPRAALQAAWHPTLPIIIASSAGGVIHLINATTGKAMAPRLKHALSNSRVGFTPDGNRAMVADLDGTVRLWEFGLAEYVESFDYSLVPELDSSLSPNRKHRALAIEDGGGIVIMDKQMGATLAKSANVDEAAKIAGSYGNVFYSPDGNYILTRDKTDLHIWGATDCRKIASLDGVIDANDPKKWLKFSSDGSRFIAVDGAEQIRVYETRSGNLVGPTIPSLDFQLRAVSISADGKLWAMGGTNSQADVFDSATGKKLVSASHRGYIAGISFNADSSLFATASLDNTCRVWDVQTGKAVSPPLRHEAYAWDVEFSPNGLQIATCGKNSAVRIWDIRTGQPLAESRISAGGLVEYSMEGDRIFYFGPDGNYRNWKLPTISGSTTNITYLARLITGRYVDDTDGFTEVEKSEFIDNIIEYRAAWFDYLDRPVPQIPPSVSVTNSLDGRSEKDFDADFQNDSAVRRHAQEAFVSETQKDWFAARFHLGRLSKSAPNDVAIEVRYHQAKGRCQAMNDEQRKRFGIDLQTSPSVEPIGGDPGSKSERERIWLMNDDLWKRVKIADDETAAPVTETEVAAFREALSENPLGTLFNTLAAAEFRLRNYEAAIPAALKSVELSPYELNLPGPHPIDLAILAISHAKLGNIQKAVSYRELFDSTLKMDHWKDDDECLDFASEVNVAFSKGD